MKNRKGFTLLELLVVVLIIGILAGIALPQYKMAVAKAKYATLKDNTRSIKSALDRYYLVNDSYTRDLTALDIELNGSLTQNNERINLSDGSSCFIGSSSTFCRRKILGVIIEYSINYKSYNTTSSCNVLSLNSTDKPNYFCQQETGKLTGIEVDNTWLVYSY